MLNSSRIATAENIFDAPIWVIFLTRSQQKCINLYFPITELKFSELYMYVLLRAWSSQQGFYNSCMTGNAKLQPFCLGCQSRCIAFLKRIFQELLCLTEISPTSQFLTVILKGLLLLCHWKRHREYWYHCLFIFLYSPE